MDPDFFPDIKVISVIKDSKYFSNKNKIISINVLSGAWRFV